MSIIKRTNPIVERDGLEIMRHYREDKKANLTSMNPIERIYAWIWGSEYLGAFDEALKCVCIQALGAGPEEAMA